MTKPLERQTSRSAAANSPPRSDEPHRIIEEDFAPPRPERDNGALDMTPMVDVTFLLLIFFMITAAFQLQKSIEIPRPDVNQSSSITSIPDDDPDDDPDDVITIIIDQFNTFRVQTVDAEAEAPSRHELLRKLHRAYDAAPADSKPTTLMVKAHGDCTHARVVTALDAGVEIGMNRVRLATIEEDI